MLAMQNWKPGMKVPSPVEEMVTVDFDGLGSTPIYKLMIGAIVPRPIALISTQSRAGVGNLAPFSFFNGVSSRPPCLMVAITRKPDGSKKDTLRNIEETGQFVVNSVGHWMTEPMNHCSAEYPFGVDEMVQVGLTPLPSVRVAPRRVKESPIHFECELYKTLEVGEGDVGSAVIVVGKILMMHVHAKAYKDGRVLLDEIAPVSRLAGASYGLTSGVFEIPRPRI